MKVRILVIIPAAVAVAMLTGCGGGQSDSADDSAPIRLDLPAEVCGMPDYISEQAPEGLCETPAGATVHDDLSPLGGIRAHLRTQ
ncbi:hypothetical protein [Agromyces sp. NPDC058126]|uniref:hypothetical protein n=1 Tax=Agromyces sp. NPDC058126 TaxID=3346350 RepID=UPI0036DB4520